MNSDIVLFFITLSLYILAIFTLFYGLIVKSEKPFKTSVNIIVAGFVFQTLSLALRWYSSGHMPGNNLYELNAVGGWFAILFFLLLQFYYPRLRVLGVFILSVSIIMMLYGISKPHGMGPLSEEYQSHWFYIHIISAFLAYSCYVVATSAALLFLSVRYRLKWLVGISKGVSEDFLEDLNVRFVAYGFGGHAVMLASGSIWANSAWGSYWSWDPVETWSLITWLIYGFHLHARLFLNWKGGRLAWTTIIALIAIIFTFWGVPHLPVES